MAAPSPFEVDLEAIMRLPEGEREAALAESRVVQRVLQENPLWRFLPHEGEAGWKREQGIVLDGSESRGQVEFMEHFWVWLVAAVAGNRFGKTHIGVADALVQTLPREFVPPWLLPFKNLDPAEREVQMRFVGVDLANWLAKAMIPKCRQLIPKAALWRGDFDKAYNDRNRQLRFADGSWWDFLTHDMELDSFASAELDRVTFDEEPPGTLGYQQFEESVGRLIDRDGNMRFTLTPLLGLTWLYEELTVNDAPRRDDEVYVVTGSLDHNPHVSQAGKERAVARWRKKDPMRAEARQHGRWVHFEGMIFPDWSRERHVVPDRPVPRLDDGSPAVNVYEAIDPGMAEDHPAAYMAAWVDEHDVLEVFHTHRIYQGTAKDMADHIHAIRDRLGFRPRWTVIDPSARNKNHQTGRSTQDEYRKHRIFTLPGQNDRLASYNAITERLKGVAPDGRYRWTVQASCEEFIEEIENYRWKRSKGRSQDAPRQEPIKINDDVIDTGRYLAMSLPGAPKRREVDDVPDHPAGRAMHERLKQIGRRGKRRRGRVGGVV